MPITKHDIPYTRFPSDNAFDIPVLRLDLQADKIDFPFLQWGTRCRKARMNGTWGFYVDDRRFNHLYRDSSNLLNSGCVSAVEPNFSIKIETSRAEAAFQIYRKRHLARLWQEMAGIRILVDLNVPEYFAEMNLMGVPAGWRAYATRGYSDLVDGLRHKYEMACTRAASRDILFLVYGGGYPVRDWCLTNPVYWLPEQEDQAGNRRIIEQQSRIGVVA